MIQATITNHEASRDTMDGAKNNDIAAHDAAVLVL